MSQIHIIDQFSTAIIPERTSDGGWISRGFKGGWMNSTLSEIPDAVEQAIRNKEFAAKASPSSNPAIIGRVVRENDHDYWSVVAVVTLGRDESRPFQAYRYFLCEGKDNLYLIVGWLNDKTKNTRIPIFDPFQQGEKVYIYDEYTQKYRNEANYYDNELNNSNQLNNYYRLQTPVILKEKQYQNIQLIDRLANKIAQDKGYPVSWSYNVEALEKPEKFLIIQPASQEAQNRLQSLELPQIAPVEITNESELKSAIQGLVRLENTRVNLKTIENILDSFNDTDIETYKKYFHKIFDELGAKDACKERVYHAGMMELLTLRAILLPETLVHQYIPYAYLNEKPRANIPFQNNSIRQQSLDFQGELYKEIKALSESLPNIKLNLRNGLLKAVEELCYDSNNISRTTLFWLIKNTQSVWYLGSQELLDSIRRDLDNIYELYRSGKLRQFETENITINSIRICKDVINYYWINRRTLPTYKSLGDLFVDLEEYDLAYYFYVVSTGKYTKEIFEKLPKNKNYIYGISIPQPVIQKNPQTTLQNQNIQTGSDQRAEIINLFLYFVLLALVIIIRLQKDIIITFLFAVIAAVFVGMYVVDDYTRAIVKKHSLPLVMFAFLLGNFGSPISFDRLKIQIPFISNNANQSPSSTTPTSPAGSDSPANWLDKAFESFTNANETKEAIERIIVNLSSDRELIDVLGLDSNTANNKIISALKQEIDLKDNYTDIIKFITDSNNNDETKRKAKLKPLLEAIYKYQGKNKLPKDGIINLVDDINTKPNSTMAVLQTGIKARLKTNKPSSQ